MYYTEEAEEQKLKAFSSGMTMTSGLLDEGVAHRVPWIFRLRP